MPGRKPLLPRIGVRADLSQMLAKDDGRLQTKNGPGKPGPIGANHRGPDRSPGSRLCAETLYFQGSETEAGKVAVANGNTAGGGQQAVDGDHQAAEQGAGGQEADRCSLGHVCPLFLEAEPFRFVIWGEIMYTRCQPQLTCLHSSNWPAALQQN